MCDVRTKEDIDGIYDDVRMIERKRKRWRIYDVTSGGFRGGAGGDCPQSKKQFSVFTSRKG
jgi:hypothetical protein